jgi:cell division septum initiation protein DivIVA
MTSRDWLSPQAGFEIVRRGGYSPEQVHEYIDRLEYDLRILTADRDGANQRLTELMAQLQASQSEADEFRNQLDRTALAPTSMANLSERMQRMVRLAEEEAAEIRARAQEANADTVAALQAEQAALVEQRKTFEAERERALAQLNQHIEQVVASANAEANRVRADAAAHGSALVSNAQAQANQLVSDAQDYSNGVRAEAQQLAEFSADERARLDLESEQRRAAIDEDFAISDAARRAQANEFVARQEHESRAQAEKLVADAQAEATRRVTEAHAESVRLVTDAAARSEQMLADATAESYRRVELATAESQRRVAAAAEDVHRRIGAAERAVDALFAMRQHVLGQLAGLQPWIDTINEATHEAAGALGESPDEFSKPAASDFDPQVGPLFQAYEVASGPVPSMSQPELEPAGPSAPADSSAPAGSSPADASAEISIPEPSQPADAERRPDDENDVSPAMRQSKRNPRLSRAFSK